MGQGRKPKPIELRILQGNPGKRPIPKDIPLVIKINEVPKAPKHLNKPAKECWKYLAEKLIKCGILSDIDIYTLEMCCIALGIIRMTTDKIREETLVMVSKKDDNTIKQAQKSPYITVLREASELFDKYGSKLGLSPSDRVKLRNIEKAATEGDPLEDFIHGNRAAN